MNLYDARKRVAATMRKNSRLLFRTATVREPVLFRFFHQTPAERAPLFGIYCLCMPRPHTYYGSLDAEALASLGSMEGLDVPIVVTRAAPGKSKPERPPSGRDTRRRFWLRPSPIWSTTCPSLLFAWRASLACGGRSAPPSSPFFLE